MYGYGGVGAGPQLGGVSGQQLEDLAALQRSTLANLPQLVGSGSQASSSKGVRTKIFLGMLAFKEEPRVDRLSKWRT